MMWRRLLTVGLVPLLTVSCFGGCREPEGSSPPVHPGVRIVSLIPSATSILLELGASGDIVGATRYCRLPGDLADVPRVGGILDVSLEAVVKLRPDVVIGSPSVLRGQLASILEESGADLLRLDFEDIEDVRAGIEQIGRAAGRNARAARLRSEFDSGLRSLGAGSVDLKVLFVVGTKPLVVASTASFQGQLLSAMGLKNVVESTRTVFPTWSLEQVIRAAPDVIIDGIAGGEPSASLLSAAGVDAPVVRMPDDLILLPSPAAVRAAGKLGVAVRAAAAGGVD